MSQSLLIKNTHYLYKNEEIAGDIFIEHGKIKDLGKIKTNVANETINLRWNFTIPGIIDPHVHVREPEESYKEDYRTLSLAAAKGGVTTMLIMPNTKPPIISVKELEKHRYLAKKSVIDYGFHFGISQKGYLEEVLNAKNIASLKVYMNRTTGNMFIQNPKYLEEIFKNVKNISVHAENEELFKAVNLAKKYNNQLYLCHVSTYKEIDFLKREKIQNIFVEVTPHHLFLKKKDQSGIYHMYPPLNTLEDKETLFYGIKNNIIDTVGSDHAPHTYEEKLSDNPPAGIPGIETLLPLLLNAMKKEIISIDDLIRLTSRNAATIFGIKNKGEIEIDYDADLCSFDLNKKYTIKNSDIVSKTGFTPFNGQKIYGEVVLTCVRGNPVYFEKNFFPNMGKEIIIERKDYV